MAGLGFGAYRFSIEWARIEPEENEFSRVELDHYRRVLAACHERGLAPYVTFHHFTTPRWVARGGGWESEVTVERFGRFCERAARHLGDLLAGACTVNEPNIVARMGYETGVFPPGRRDRHAYERATQNFVAGHRRAREAIKGAAGSLPVGITLAMSDYQALPGAEDRVRALRQLREDVFLEATRDDDFIGVQTYHRTRVGPDGELGPEEGVERTIMGYEFWPDALEATIRRAWEVSQGTPVLVTENGVATHEDDRRVKYIDVALACVRRCLADGIEILGYFYWSALDNFEWAYGYEPTFGLIEVNRSTQERIPKPSARWLGEIARSQRARS